MDTAFLEGMTKGRFFASLEAEEMSCMEALLHQRQQPSTRLGKKLVGMLRNGNQIYEPWCQLVVDVIVQQGGRG